MKELSDSPALAPEKSDVEALARRLDTNDPEQLQQFFTAVDETYRNSCIFRMVSANFISEAAAEELFQEALLKAFRNISTFNPRMPFRNWLFKILRNLILDFKRAKNNQHFQTVSVREEDQSPEPVDVLIFQETVERVRTAIAGLRKKERDLVVAKYFHDVPTEVLYRELGFTTTTSVHTLHQRVLRRLEEIFEKREISVE